MASELVMAVDLAGDRIEGDVEVVCLSGLNLVLCDSHLFQNDCLSAELF